MVSEGARAEPGEKVVGIGAQSSELARSLEGQLRLESCCQHAESHGTGWVSHAPVPTASTLRVFKLLMAPPLRSPSGTPVLCSKAFHSVESTARLRLVNGNAVGAACLLRRI